MRIVIPSRQRATVLRDHTLPLLPGATVCVGEDEVEAYREVTDDLLVHPSDVVGLAPVKQWILDHVADDVVVIAADDILRVWSLVGMSKRRITDPDMLHDVLCATAQCAEDAGAALFGFATAPDVRHYTPHEHFHLTGWCAGVMGFVGRRVRFDPFLLLRPDTDVCLTAMRVGRIVWLDKRYSFEHENFFAVRKGKFGQVGGNAGLRSSERQTQESAYLQRKWGPYYHVARGKQTVNAVTRVPRRQR